VETTTETQEEVTPVEEEKIDPTYNQPQTQKDASDDCLGEALCQATKPKQKREKKEKKAKVNKVEKEKKSKKVSSRIRGPGRDTLSREDVEFSEDTFKPVLCERYIPPPPNLT